MYRLTSLIFALGLTLLLFGLVHSLDFGHAPMLIGDAIDQVGVEQVGAANLVTSVVLGYRGIDTLGELAILFAAATAAGLVLGGARRRRRDDDGGSILVIGADLMFPLLVTVGITIVLHGHLTPGGGFQGGVILAAAFFLPLLAKPGSDLNHRALSIIEGLAGASVIIIGLWALWSGGEFLQPMLSKGDLGSLFSAGTLPLLYLAVGLKVGAELAGLLATIAETEASD